MKMMKKIMLRLLIMAWGAIGFWAPVTVVGLIMWQRVDLVTGTLLPPATYYVSYVFVRRKYFPSVRPISLWMLWGIFVFGYPFWGLGLMPVGGGFAAPPSDWWVEVKFILQTMLFPILNAEYALAQGSGYGVTVAVVLAVVIHDKLERKDNRLRKTESLGG